MKIEVTRDVAEEKSAGEKTLNLSSDLRLEFGPQPTASSVEPRCLERSVYEVPAAVDQIGNMPMRERRLSVAQNEMKSDAEIGSHSTRHHCRMGRRRAHAQAGAGDDSGVVAGHHSVVDFRPATEVVDGDDDGSGTHRYLAKKALVAISRGFPWQAGVSGKSPGDPTAAAFPLPVSWFPSRPRGPAPSRVSRGRSSPHAMYRTA